MSEVSAIRVSQDVEARGRNVRDHRNAELVKYERASRVGGVLEPNEIVVLIGDRRWPPSSEPTEKDTAIPSRDFGQPGTEANITLDELALDRVERPLHVFDFDARSVAFPETEFSVIVDGSKDDRILGGKLFESFHEFIGDVIEVVPVSVVANNDRVPVAVLLAFLKEGFDLRQQKHVIAESSVAILLEEGANEQEVARGDFSALVLKVAGMDHADDQRRILGASRSELRFGSRLAKQGHIVIAEPVVEDRDLMAKRAPPLAQIVDIDPSRPLGLNTPSGIQSIV